MFFGEAMLAVSDLQSGSKWTWNLKYTSLGFVRVQVISTIPRFISQETCSIYRLHMYCCYFACMLWFLTFFFLGFVCVFVHMCFSWFFFCFYSGFFFFIFSLVGCFCYGLVFACLFFKKREKRRKVQIGRWGRSGKRWRMRNHDQNYRIKKKRKRK